MTDKEKKLYESIKGKTRQQIKRRVRNVFTDHHKKLKNFSQKEQTLLGNFLTVLEMDIKEVL